MKYYISYRVKASYIAEITADSIEEAKSLIEDGFYKADFGDAEDVEGTPISVEDENGNEVWLDSDKY